MPVPEHKNLFGLGMIISFGPVVSLRGSIGGLPELVRSPVVAADLYVVAAAVVRALLPQDPFGHAKRP